MTNPFKKVVLIGAGNVATHLGTALKSTDSQIIQVYSRTKASAESLAVLLESQAICNLSDLCGEADLYIISVLDSAVEGIVSQIRLTQGTVVHTSGSLPMNILAATSKNHGVIYIPQTFVKEVPLDYKNLHFFIEASTEEVQQKLFSFSKQISEQVTFANAEQRYALHLAAVMVSNFTNCLYSLADEILSKENISLSVLQPLIMETARKPEYGNPKLLQTGPAKRKDEKIIQKHLDSLKSNQDYSDLYSLFTKIIQKEIR